MLLSPTHLVSTHMIGPKSLRSLPQLSAGFSQGLLCLPRTMGIGDLATNANSRCGLTNCTYNLLKMCRYTHSPLGLRYRGGGGGDGKPPHLQQEDWDSRRGHIPPGGGRTPPRRWSGPPLSPSAWLPDPSSV